MKLWMKFLSMFFYWDKGILNSYTQVFKIFQRSTAEHMFLIFDNNKVILKNLTRWKFLVKKEDMSREKSMYGIYDNNTSCSYLWLIQQHDQYAEHNTTTGSCNMGGYRSKHMTQDAKSHEQGSKNFPKICWPHSNSGSQKDDKKQVLYWWSTTQKWH